MSNSRGSGIQNPIQAMQSWYIMVGRKESTMIKLFKDHKMLFSDVEKLKTAKALYDTIPVFIQSPFLYFYLRQMAQPRSIPATLKVSSIYNCYSNCV